MTSQKELTQFSLGEVFREFNVPDANKRSSIQSTSMQRISEFITDTCSTLMEYCAPILIGEPAIIERLRVRRKLESEKYTLSLKLSGIRQEVDDAWRTKNYVKYRELLAGLESVLTETEKQKLEFASTRSTTK